MSVFAERLRNLRDSKGHTQDEVGKAVGKSRESVSKYEMGEREPDPDAIAALAKYFNVSANYILGITDDLITLTDLGKRPYCKEILWFENYLQDEKFVPYFTLAIKMRDYELDVSAIDKHIYRMVQIVNKQKHP